MFSKKFVAVASLSTLFLVASCSKEDPIDTKQDTIWTEYEMLYNKNENKTHVIARYRLGGKTGAILQLTESTGAKVIFKDTQMPYSSIWSAHHLEFTGRLTYGIFSYTNTNGTTYKNAVPTNADTIAFPAGFDTIVKSQAETFSWIGNPLTTDERVQLFVGPWTWSNTPLFFSEAYGATNAILGVEAKNNIALGQTSVFLDRIAHSNYISGPSAGGTIRYTYRTVNTSVMVVP